MYCAASWHRYFSAITDADCVPLACTVLELCGNCTSTWPVPAQPAQPSSAPVTANAAPDRRRTARRSERYCAVFARGYHARPLRRPARAGGRRIPFRNALKKANIAWLNAEQVKAKNVIKKEQNRINSKRYRQNCNRNEKLKIERLKKYKTFHVSYRPKKQDENEKEYYDSKKGNGKKV